ncbi:MAG TPA: HEPN domain-containing protein [Candidatus Dojkabacteria bacterium]|nr:HEPN domain-containing protein [Candidatus Dojkabacteria bacterium]
MDTTRLSISKQRFQVWMHQAHFDLEAGLLSLKHNYHEWAAYQAEQTVEKALKAVIAHAGVHPPRMHKLPVLISFCNKLNKKFKATRFNFKYVESFTFIARYPFLIPGKENKTPHELITHAQAEKAIFEAQDIYTKIGGILGEEPAHAVTEEHKIIGYSAEQINSRLAEISSLLEKEFNPERIVLFGRFAREKVHSPTGTMDILIIAETELPFLERIIKARKVTSGGEPIIEPLVYTPEEFKTMTEVEGDSFFENALNEGEEIYKKSN